jgi:hypothetical protein
MRFPKSPAACCGDLYLHEAAEILQQANVRLVEVARACVNNAECADTGAIGGKRGVPA